MRASKIDTPATGVSLNPVQTDITMDMALSQQSHIRGIRNPVSNVTFDRRVKDRIASRARELNVSQARLINYLLAQQLGVPGLGLDEPLDQSLQKAS